jgi:hypothetical protein
MAYKIESEREVAFFIDLMFVFGEGFDNDPNLPWAREILNDHAITNSETRAELLREKAFEHENAIVNSN